MDVRLITPQGMERHESDQIGSLLDGSGLLWIDVAYWDAWTEEKLVKLLGLDPGGARLCGAQSAAQKHTCTRSRYSWCCTGPSGGLAGTCITSNWTSTS